MEEKEIKKAVREGYARIAKKESSCCAPADMAVEISKNIGYRDDELNSVPEDANLGLGCGNPVALASLKEGETVLDLGSGAGFDCFLAANRVRKEGWIIGVDMTPEMIQKAKENARAGNYGNVEFRQGEIDNIPAAANSIDVVISNCVINLAPDKGRVFKEAFRVLKPGGRLMVSDIVLLKELPDGVKNSIGAYIGCLCGAVMKDEYLNSIKIAGFSDIEVVDEFSYPFDLIANDSTAKAVIEYFNFSIDMIKETAESIVSIKVQGKKPG